MKYTLATLGLLAFVLLFSCRKKQDDNPYLPHYTLAANDYATLYPGNYWIYELYHIDDQGNASPSGQLDSAYVLPDSSVNGRSYHVLVMTEAAGMPKSPLLLRDSLHYLTDVNGQVHFATDDFNTVFSNSYDVQPAYAPHDSIGLRQTQMADSGLTVLVPAGSFITNAYRTTWFLHPHWAAATGATRRLYDRYALHTGIVSRTLPFYPGSKAGEELRLVRYHVVYPVQATQ